MKLTYDWNNKLTQSKMFLANPQKNYIGIISGAKDLNYSLKFSNMYEISFKIYNSKNGVKNKYYDKIIEKRLVEVQNVGWFQIQNVNETDDGLISYKEVALLALENELIGKRIFDISGVYSLYDITDTENSLLQIISKESGWSIAHVDNNLKTKCRTLSIDSAQIYNLLTQDLSKSFQCIFTFDSYDKSISAYELENVGELTDIFISKKNILKEWQRESNADQIVTKLKVVGADGVDIRDVNPTSTNYLINIDYFKTTEWMTQGLINSLNNYQSIYDNYFTQYNTTLSLLKRYQSELTTLQSELTDLESQKNSAEIICGTYVTQLGRVPLPSDSEYTLYQTSLNKVNSLTPQIANKKLQISSKQQQIDNTRITLDNIGVDLNQSKFFTQEQLNELNTFLTENEEYSDPTFVVADQMTEDEITELKLELMNNGAAELQRISQPNYTFNITASNLFSICNSKEGLSYDKWKNKLQLGNLITLQLRDDYWITVRLIQIDIDFNDLTNIKLTFSNKNRLDNELVQFEEIVAQSGRTASALSLSKFGYDKAADMNSDVQRFMTGTLNATLNKMVNNDNQEVLIDQFGLHARKWLPDQNKYSNYQSWWNNNTLMFTNDSWKTSQTAIGLLTAPDGSQYYGVATEILIGNLILGSKLKIVNTSGTYSIDNNGFSAVNGIYSVVINPNKPNEIFKIAVNNQNKFYVDTINNRLVMYGEINATNGTLGNLTVTGTLTGGNITGSKITGAMINGGTIDGATITSYSTAYQYTEIKGGIITSTQVVIPYSNTDTSYLLLLSSTHIDMSNSGVTRFSVDSNGNVICKNITCSTINSKTPSYEGHTHSGYASTDHNHDGRYSTPNHGHATANSIGATLSSSQSNGWLIQFYNTSGNTNAATAEYVKSYVASSSDERLKKNIVQIDDITNKYMELRPVSYRFKEGAGNNTKTNFGFIAQDIDKIFPKEDYALVNKDDLPIDGQKQYCPDYVLTLNQNNLHAIHTKMIQKHEHEINELKEILRQNNIM